MLQTIEEGSFDQAVFSSDWRYSAAIVGLIRYFDFCKDNEKLSQSLYQVKDIYNNELHCEDEALLFSSEDITEERYLNFVEYRYGMDLEHFQVRKMLESGTLIVTSEERKKAIQDWLKKKKVDKLDEAQEQELVDNLLIKKTKLLNSLLKHNKPLKDVFGNTIYDGTNGNEIVKLIDENWLYLTKEIYRRKKDMYSCFCNEGALLVKSLKSCRLLGYYIDASRKSNAQGYGFDSNRFNNEDNIIFDFVPFAFHGGEIKYFFNNNFSINELIKSDSILLNVDSLIVDKKNVNVVWESPERVFWEYVTRVTEHKHGDLEVISKLDSSINRDDAKFFKTVFLRESASKILCSLGTYKEKKSGLHQGEKYRVIDELFAKIKDKKGQYQRVEVEEFLIANIIDNQSIDGYIEKYLSYYFSKKEHVFLDRLLNHLIDISVKIRQADLVQLKKREGVSMDDKMNMYMLWARKSAELVRKAFEGRSNKLNTYKYRLLTAAKSHDYNDVCLTLIDLSEYSGVNIAFADALIEDFEGNTPVLFKFLRELGPTYQKESESK